MITSPNMSLTRWDLGSDPYSHTQLSANFDLIDLHDHTPGKGRRLVTNSYTDKSVTEAKLADDVISTIKIQDGAVTEEKLDVAFIHPLGQVIPWWRPNGLTAVPQGWVIATGQSLSAAEHSFPGGGTIALPDLRNKFLLGADVSSTGTSTTTPPDIGGTGGAHTVNLTHSHTVNAHSHTVNAHSHVVNAHAHRVEDHRHDMFHTHTFPMPIIYDLDTEGMYAVWPGSDFFERNVWTGSDGNVTAVERLAGYNLLYDVAPLGTEIDLAYALPGPTPANPATHLNMETYFCEVSEPRAYGHPNDLNRETGAKAPMTDPQAPGTSSVSPGTSTATPGTDNQLSVVDNRSAYVGLLYIMKVKYG